MTAHSLKTIKVKHKARFVGSKQRNSDSHVGFTDKEAQGIFGCRYEYTDDERAYIARIEKAREEWRRNNPQLYRKAIASDREKETAQERRRKINEACAALDAKNDLKKQHDELKSLGLNLVGFKQENGQITYL